MRQRGSILKSTRALLIFACLFASANFAFAVQAEALKLSVDQSVSPYEIKRAIETSHRSGERRVEFDIAALWNRLEIPANNFEACGSGCEVKIFLAELDGEPGREVLLRLATLSDSVRYLVFKQVKARVARQIEWKLLGFVDHDFNRYEMARHRTVNAFGRHFLVIRGQEGSGTGYALYSDTWYEVSGKGVQPVLSYPVEGHTYPWPAGLAREFKAATFQHFHAGDEEEITVLYNVSYSALDYTGQAAPVNFFNQYRERYKWDERQGHFVFTPLRSNLDVKEIYAIANIADEEQEEQGEKIGGTTFYSSKKSFVGGGYEVFLRHNFYDLLKIAQGRNASRKEWLRQFLSECDEMYQKDVLLRELEK
ncbi:MAG: hypothetical protein WBP93_15995 [Pyrinomonadaceae bacterium]